MRSWTLVPEPIEGDAKRTSYRSRYAATTPLALQVQADGAPQAITLASVQQRLDGMPHASADAVADAFSAIKLSVGKTQLDAMDPAFIDVDPTGARSKRLVARSVSDLLIAVEYNVPV